MMINTVDAFNKAFSFDKESLLRIVNSIAVEKFYGISYTDYEFNSAVLNAINHTTNENATLFNCLAVEYKTGFAKKTDKDELNISHCVTLPIETFLDILLEKTKAFFLKTYAFTKEKDEDYFIQLTGNLARELRRLITSAFKILTHTLYGPWSDDKHRLDGLSKVYDYIRERAFTSAPSLGDPTYNLFNNLVSAGVIFTSEDMPELVYFPKNNQNKFYEYCYTLISIDEYKLDDNIQLVKDYIHFETIMLHFIVQLFDLPIEFIRAKRERNRSPKYCFQLMKGFQTFEADAVKLQTSLFMAN